MKVFGIGFHKTGTTSLDAALRELGYDVAAARPGLATALFADDYDKIWAIADQKNAFNDNPWAVLYAALDARYPGSKFILTIREDGQWLQSIVNHFGTTHTEMRRWIYGVGFPLGNEAVYLERYRKHNAVVRAYFSERPDDLLVVSWEKGDGWDELCAFLEQDVPGKPFPHKNKGGFAKAKKMIQQVRRVVKRRLSIF